MIKEKVIVIINSNEKDIKEILKEIVEENMQMDNLYNAGGAV